MKKFVFSLILLTTGLSPNVIQIPISFEEYISNLESHHEKHTRVKQPSKIKNVLSALGKAAEFSFKNYDKILSKKFAAALIILGAPYLYFSDTALELTTRHITDFTLKMSGAVTTGILNAMIDNPMTLAKIMTIMAANQTGQKFAEKAGIKLAEILLTVITLGKYKV